MNGRQCTATNRAGQRCRRAPAQGTTVCSLHGGKAPQVRQKAAERIAANDALAALARRGIAPVDNPLAALSELAGEIVATKDIFRERVTELRQESWRYSSDAGGEQLRAEIALYERALDRSVKVLADIARLKIDERLTAITEHQARTLAAVITAVLERLELGDQEEHVRDLVAAELERLAA